MGSVCAQRRPWRWSPRALAPLEPAAALLAAGGRDVTCHAEKPVAIIIGEGEATIHPFQLIRIGNLAVAGLARTAQHAGRQLSPAATTAPPSPACSRR